MGFLEQFPHTTMQQLKCGCTRELYTLSRISKGRKYLIRLIALITEASFFEISHTALLTNKVTLNNVTSRARNINTTRLRESCGAINLVLTIDNSKKVRYSDKGLNRQGAAKYTLFIAEALFGYFGTFHLNVEVTQSRNVT